MHTSASLLLICQCWLCVAEIHKGILKVWGKQRIIASHIKKKTALYLIPDAILLKIALVISFSREILMAVFL